MANKRQIAVTTRIVSILVILFLIVTIVSQLFIHYYNPLKTEPAVIYNFEDYIQSMGVFVRSEKCVNYSGGGIISYVYSDGEKLAKNSSIAQIYSSQSDLSIQRQIDELNRQIEVLKDAEKLIGSDNSQIEAFSNQIYENHTKIMQYIADGDYASASSLKNDYLNLQSKRQIVNGTTGDYKSKIAELESRIAALNGQITALPKDLTLQDTGYFVSSVDGYESSLNYDSIDDLTEAKIEEIIKNPVLSVDSSAVGKIISDYKWKMICVVSGAQSINIYKNAVLDLRIGNEITTAKAVVENVKDLPSGNKMLVLDFDVLNQNFVSNRTAKIKILFDEYSGIRIPSSAIHFDDEGKMGVFIKLGVNIYFRYIDVVRTEGDYTLVKDTTDKNGYLSLYDSVIVEGTGLYDGKIVLQ